MFLRDCTLVETITKYEDEMARSVRFIRRPRGRVGKEGKGRKRTEMPGVIVQRRVYRRAFKVVQTRVSLVGAINQTVVARRVHSPKTRRSGKKNNGKNKPAKHAMR